MNVGTGNVERNAYGIFTAIIFIVLTVGCTTPRKVPFEKTKVLAPGMSYEEVILALGEPETTAMINDDWELGYYFYKGFPYQEWLPYKLVLDKNTRRLKSWALDEEQSQKDQAIAQKWSQALGLTGPPDGGGASGGQPTSQPAAPAGPGQTGAGAVGTTGYLPATRFCMGSAPSVMGGSYSRVHWFEFDGRGRFQSGGETSSSGSAGQAYMGGGGGGGAYALQGDSVVLRYDNGSQLVLTVYYRQNDGMITELKSPNEKLPYAPQMCRIIYGD